MQTSANFSRCKKYRYALWRIWQPDAPLVLIVGLNPSTADAVQDDPTIRRCIGFARDWGFGRLCVANLFAYRATLPTDLKQAKDPIGPANKRWLSRLVSQADEVVAAWGNDGSFMQQGEQFLQKYPNVACIRLNSSGEPAHPLYIKKDTPRIPILTARKRLPQVSRRMDRTTDF